MLTAEDVAAAYRLWLSRSPESEAVVQEHIRRGSHAALAEAFAGSEEAAALRLWPIGRAQQPVLPVTEAQLAEVIARHLLRDAGGHRIAFETAHPVDGDDWAWTDDNAKIVQFLSHPALHGRFAAELEACLAFLHRMTDGPFVFRKLARARLEPARGFPGWVHALWNIEAPTGAATLRAGPRFHDGRSCWSLTLSGHEVRAVIAGQLCRLPLEQAWTAHRAVQDGPALLLESTAVLPVGTLRLRHRIHAATPLIETSMELELDPAATPEQVELLLVQERLSHGEGDVRFQRLALAGPAGEALVLDPPPGASGSLDAAGRDFVMLAQTDTQKGFANAIHLLAGTPALHRLEWAMQAGGSLDRSATVHRFDRPAAGATLRAVEHRLITQGGLYDQVASYRRFLWEELATPPGAMVRDRSISYDYGVELDALAKAHAAARARGDADAPALLAAADRLLAAYLEHFVGPHRAGADAIFSRQLAFATMGAATLLGATGAPAHREALALLVGALLDFEHRFTAGDGRTVSVFLMGRLANRDAYPDCHSAALLALLAAAPLLEDQRLLPALVGGLGSYALGSAELGPDMGGALIDSVHVRWVDGRGAPRDHPAPWSYQAALTLRLLLALAQGRDPVARAAAAAHRDRLPLLIAVLGEQLRRAMRVRTVEEVEFLSSAASGETNSETQPWVGMALFGHPFG